MTADNLLSRLEAVRRSSRGWIARCPAHADRSPSLSIAEGERCLLLKCWSGCRPEEITKALGLRMRDLFFDSGLPPDRRQEMFRKRQVERQRQEDIDYAVGASIDAEREASKLIHSAKGIDISPWTPEKLHEALNELAIAHDMLFEEVVNDGAGTAI